MRRAAMEQNSLSHSKFLEKLNKIPVVSKSFAVISDYYGKAKDSKGVIGTTTRLAENITVTVAGKVTPLAQKMATPLGSIDAFAARTLEKVEQTVPVINKEPQEIMSSTKELITTKVSPVVNTYNRASEAVLSNKVAQTYFDVVEYVLNTAGRTLDTVLPPQANEDKNAVADPERPSARGGWLVRKAFFLASTATRRLFAVAQNRVETAAATTDVVFKSAQKAVKNMLPDGVTNGESKNARSNKKPQ